MVIVALVLMIVFLFRDVQILAIRGRAVLPRFAGYAILLAAAVALMRDRAMPDLESCMRGRSANLRWLPSSFSCWNWRWASP